jgi:hypothetical protein
MPALAPTVTQSVAADLTPCPAGTKVADLAPGAGETDPGPFTYTVSTGSAVFSISGVDLNAAVDLSGANDVGVTVTGSDATASPETTATITVGTFVDPPPEETDDPYAGNPQIPAPLPPGTSEMPWEFFMKQATLMLRPNARDGVDFAVDKTEKGTVPANAAWNDAVLGPRPDAEIEALARELAAGSPFTPIP